MLIICLPRLTSAARSARVPCLSLAKLKKSNKIKPKSIVEVAVCKGRLKRKKIKEILGSLVEDEAQKPILPPSVAVPACAEPTHFVELFASGWLLRRRQTESASPAGCDNAFNPVAIPVRSTASVRRHIVIQPAKLRMLTESGSMSSAEDLPPGGKRRKLRPESDAGCPAGPAVDRTRCRLFVGFPEGHLRDVSQASTLFPTATSVQLPRAVDCQFESPAEAAAVAARLQSEVAAGRLSAAEVTYVERRQTGEPPGRRTVLRDMTRLHVRGIQRTATVSELRQLFVGCDDVTVPGNNARGNNGYAFVQFPDRESAAAIMTQQLKLHDKQLTVSYAVERNLQRAGDPKFELVEIDSESGGDRAKQNVTNQASGDSSKTNAVNDKGKKRKYGKDGKPSQTDVYKNHSTVVSS